MVLIEPVTSSEEISERKPLVVKAAEPSADGVSSTASGGAVAASGYCSDGYETASETEHNDSDEAEGKEDEHIHSHRGITEENVKKDNTNSATKLSTSAGHEEGQKHETEQDMDKLNETAIALANDLKLEGNSLFRDGLHEEALLKYELALQAARNAPMSTEIQSICHANRASCFSKLGNHAETIKECTKALELNPTYLKVLLRRAEAHEKLDHYDEAIKDMKSILELEPSHDQARRALVRLKPLADEKHEKMKEEMIGKLKEMGNSILGRFGMSVDNFKAVKDPNTGSYSISFQQ